MPADREKILLIGATGRIGRIVASELGRRRIAHRLMSRDPARRVEVSAEADVVAGDLDDSASLERAMAGCTKLFLASAVGSTQVAQHSRVFAAAKHSGIRHVVRISTEAVLFPERMKLAQWHAASEAELEDSGLDFTHVRPCNFMHNMLVFSASVAREGEIRAPFGEGRMTLIDVRDIAAVAVAALIEDSHRGKAYRVTGEDWLGYDEIATIIAANVGKPVRYVPIDQVEARGVMAAEGYPPWLVEDLFAMYDVLGADLTPSVTNVVSKVTGRRPRRFTSFVRENVEAFRRGGPSH